MPVPVLRTRHGTSLTIGGRKMKLARLTLLDVIVVIVGCVAAGLVAYLWRVQRHLYLSELLFMALFIVGYTRYRVTRKKEPIQPPVPARGNGT